MDAMDMTTLTHAVLLQMLKNISVLCFFPYWTICIFLWHLSLAIITKITTINGYNVTTTLRKILVDHIIYLCGTRNQSTWARRLQLGNRF